MVRDTLGALAIELRSLDFYGRRGLESLAAGLSVALAAIIALALHSDQAWWAAISAFMVARSTLTEELTRGALRILGSAVGAAAAVVVIGLFAYDSLPLVLCMFVLAWAGLFGFAASRYGYAWLMIGITANLVILIALDQPPAAFSMAVERVIDVAIGISSSVLVTALLPDPPKPAAAGSATQFRPPPALFWLHRHRAEFEQWLRHNWPLILHACRGGLTVMLLPALSGWLAPLSSTQIGITAVAVMSIPTTAILEPDSRTVVMRATHRLFGCLLGAALGLICLGWAGISFLVWLPMLIGGTWLFWQIQTGSTGIAYLGTQGGIAFLMSLIQGQGPPLSITPGIDRIAGITAGLTLLLLITMIMSLFRLPHLPPTRTAGD